MYFKRIVDKTLDLKLEAFGATLIVGPKWCGKTATALQKVKSVLDLQDPDNIQKYIDTAAVKPSRLLLGEKPRLIDEWQDIPELWDAMRKDVDKTQQDGLYILTGSTSKNIKTKHTGTGRITTLKMYPMSLYESKESNGKISLKELFNNKEIDIDGISSELSLEDLIFSACRGGWSSSLFKKSREAQLEVAKDYFKQIYEKDISSIDNVKRNQNWTRAILKSYARNISTLAKKSVILKDIQAQAENMSEDTLATYINALERLHIINDIEAWCPAIRSATMIRSGKKREFIDPSLVVAALGASPEYFYQDLKKHLGLFLKHCVFDI